MAKTNITAYDMKEMFKSLYETLKYDIVLIDEDTGENKSMEINDYLRTDFYTYYYDTRQNNNFDDLNGNGFNFPNYDTWLNSRGSTSTSYGQVELSGLEVVASEDIDMGSATAKITFVMPYEKIDILDAHINKLRLFVAGVRNTFVNADNDTISFYASLGELQYDAEPYNTPLGKCILASLTFNIAFMQDAVSSNQSEVEISLDGTNYDHLYYNQMTQNIIFNGKPNLMQNKPYASGTIISSASYTMTISYWIYIQDNVQLALNNKIMSVVNDNETYTDLVNIPIWVKETIKCYEPNYLDPSIRELINKTIKTKMVVANYTINKKNSDFINVSLVLNRYGK